MNANGKFVSGEKKQIKAKAGKKAVDAIIPPGLALKFEIEEKDMPKGLPQSWDGFQLIWINNIGLRSKLQDAELIAGEFYEVQFEKVSLPGSETTLVYWNGTNVVEFSAEDYGETGDEKMAVRLNLIDPPIGIGGR